MNKKVLAAAIAAAAALPMAAQAGVVIYGKIHVSVDYVDTSDITLVGDEDGIQDLFSFDESTWLMESGAGERDSRLGFKGSEDLGNGLKAIWKYEQAIDLTDLGAGFDGARNAYIGLAGDWGTVFGGQHDTPMKISTGKLDYFGDTLADYNSALGIEDIRAPNVIAYISPAMAGLTFAIAGHFSERVDDSSIDNGYSAALMYSNNGLYGSVAYEDLGESAFCVDPDEDCNVLAGVSDSKWRVGLGWEGNAFGVAGVYESQSNKGGELFGQDGDIWQVSAKWKFGNSAVKGMFGQTDYDNFDTRDAWAVGFDHNLSKRTMVYALYAQSDWGLRSSIAKPSLTIEEGPDGEAVVTGQDDAKGFSLGMVHKF